MTIEDYGNLLDRLENDDERRIMKILMENAFPEMIDYFQGKVDELKNEILSESILNLNRQEIALTIWPKERMGALSDGLFPMKPWDAEKANSKRQGRFVYFSVYLEAEDGEIEERQKTQYLGKILWKDQELDVPVSLKKNTSYVEITQELRKSFISDDIAWIPLNAGYLEKFYYLVAELPEDAEIPEDAEFESLKVQDFDLNVRERVIPVWNVERITMTSNDFPIIQENKALYQYTFLAERNAEYVPDHQMALDGECVRRGESLIILMKDNEQRKFTFWKIVKEDWEKIRPEDPVFTNGVKNALIGRPSAMPMVHSPFELERAVHQLSVSRFVKFTGYKVRPHDYFDHATSAFQVIRAKEAEDRIAQISKRDYLELSFENAGVKSYLFGNVLGFIADVIQREFREFQVIAVANDAGLPS